MSFGQWINYSNSLINTITAMSTSSGDDTSGKNMKSYVYTNVELDFPISDIWLIKKRHR